jgi:predicted SpoU family rRNA methylase
MLRTERIDRVRSSCVNGKKFNSINVSYWEGFVKESRDNELKIHLIKNGKSIEEVEDFMKYYNSALIVVMKDLCPDVW